MTVCHGVCGYSVGRAGGLPFPPRRLLATDARRAEFARARSSSVGVEQKSRVLTQQQQNKRMARGKQTVLGWTTVGVLHVRDAVVSEAAHRGHAARAAALVRALLVGLLHAVAAPLCGTHLVLPPSALHPSFTRSLKNKKKDKKGDCWGKKERKIRHIKTSQRSTETCN